MSRDGGPRVGGPARVALDGSRVRRGGSRAPADPGGRRRRLALGAGLALALVSARAVPVGAQIEVLGATITELQEAMASGRTTSAEITEAYLARIRAYDESGPRLNAIIWLNPNARSEAAALDRERAERGVRGPLHGIPIILKDNYDTFDMPTSAGALALATSVPPDDAFQVRKLREAGAVILGKANMHELASGITTIGSLGGQTLNPYDLRRNPGGSSGGTGAAIAASFAAVGWGSDTCGSIRIPASQNDLVGLRPTKGLSSIDGIVPLSHTQDVAGPLARTVRDLAIALDATVGPDPADPATALLEGRDVPGFVDALDADALAGARLGILPDLFDEAPEEEAAGRLVRAALGRMVELGADTLSVEIPRYDELVAGSSLIGHEFKWDLIDYLAATPGAPVSSLGEMLDLGLIHRALAPRMRVRDEPTERDGEEYRVAYAKRAPLREAIEAALGRYQVDALVFPTMRNVPAFIGEPQLGSSCSLSANSGLPAISVPVGFTDDGLPIGMEMVGRTLDDARLVSLAYGFEQHTDHRRNPDSTPALVDGAAPPRIGGLVHATAAGYPEPPRSDAEVTVAFDVDLTTRRLTYTVADVTGVEAADVIAVVLRYPDEEGRWVVARRLTGPGVTLGDGSFLVDATLRERLLGGAVVLELFTRSHPLGAARAAVRLGG